MQFQPDSSGPAGSALRTTGEPRRGRCEKSTGADGSLFSRAFGRAVSRLRTVMSSSPAPHRFAHRAAPLKPARSSRAQARAFASGSISITVSKSSRVIVMPWLAAIEVFHTSDIAEILNVWHPVVFIIKKTCK